MLTSGDQRMLGLRRVTRVLAHGEEHPLAQASRLASCFRLARAVEVHDFAEKGNINQHTYLVQAGTPAPSEYLLQRINERVFTRPRSVMRAMISVGESGISPVPSGSSALRTSASSTARESHLSS